MNGIQRGAWMAGPVLALALGGGLFVSGLSLPACWCGAIALWCGIWWIFQPVALPVTALIPMALFPFTGVLDHKTVAGCYGNPIIMMVLGGFLLSVAMERSGAHRRVALGILCAVGKGYERRIVLGFLLSSVLISMWMSNTATTLILIPVALATLEGVSFRQRLAPPLLLAIAYGATFGGMGTPVGSPTNLMFMGAYQATTGIELSFIDWMTFAMPIVIIMIPVTWFWLTRGLGTEQVTITLKSGPWKSAERRVLMIFGFTAVAWLTRTIPYGGWSSLLNLTGVGDDSVALIAAVALFLLPNGEGGQLLNWNDAKGIPWGILVLLAGGIAISKGFESTGLNESLGGLFAHLTMLPVLIMMLQVCFIATFISEMASNTAVTAMLMPILAAAATASEIDPLLLMAPGVIGASCGFMLPVATGPNAVVFGTNELTSRQMARVGFPLDLSAILVTTGVCYVLFAK